jgi:hypothetical protein
VARSVANAAQSLSLEDVGGPELFDFASAQTTVAEYRTFDGLVVTATTAQQDDKTYLKVAARAEAIVGPELPPAEAAPAEEPPAPEGEPADAATEGETAAAAEPPSETSSETSGAETGDEAVPEEPAEEKPPQKTFEEITAEAEAINAKVANWTYVIPSWSATNLRKRQSELLKPLEPETPEAAPGDDPFGVEGGAAAGDEPSLDELLRGLEESAEPPPEDGR